MGSLGRLFNSSVGQKYLMAVSGLVLFLFLVAHLAGNLQLFSGAERFNAYARWVGSWPVLLWVVRLGLVTMAGLHLWSATVLTLENRAARPVRYERANEMATSYASRTMMLSGVIVGVFVLGHLLHYSLRAAPLGLTGEDFASLRYQFGDGLSSHDTHKMVVLGFSAPAVSIFYILGVGLLCLHLSHGLGAMFQSAGLKNRAWAQVIDNGACVISALLFAGYAAIPIAVLLGYGR